MINMQELLYNRGLDKNGKIKLVRHKDRRVDLYEKYKTERQWFLAYQSLQGKPVFHELDYIVSFVGEEGSFSRFIGVYKIVGIKNPNYQLDGFPEGKYMYEMSEVDGFEDLKERVIIKWSNPISWHQSIKNEMEVIEIKPGLHYKQFTDYFDFILSFRELKEIVENNYNSDWRKMLSAVKGIYLITDTKKGKLYIGSAYGERGIWGRWNTYVKTNGHGENKLLKKLIAEDNNYANYFNFSILMLLPKTVTADEAISKEKLFKKKLGTNSLDLGLNLN